MSGETAAARICVVGLPVTGLTPSAIREAALASMVPAADFAIERAVAAAVRDARARRQTAYQEGTPA